MFSDIPLTYFDCTHRTISPSKTIANNEKKLKDAGITRLTEISGLDRIGIPVFSCIRPTAQDGGVSVYAGKGATVEQAKASAMMEGFERYSGERKEEDKNNIIIKTPNEIEGNYIHPESLILSKEVDKTTINDSKIEWTISKDIISEEDYYIPANAIYHPYIIPENSDITPLFKGNTNGLASGNVLEEAVLHGIFEVVERDAWSIFELTKKNKKQIDIKTIENPLINNLLKKFEDNSINIKLMDLTADIGIATIAASSDDTLLEDPALLTLGVGTHLNGEIAVLRALTEVAQSRATQIHGTREDTSRANFMRKAGYRRMKKINHHYFEEEDDKINLSDIENKSTNSLKQDIEICQNEILSSNLDKILFKDLTRSEIGINVVRVIIPNTEVFALDPDRIGTRFKKIN